MKLQYRKRFRNAPTAMSLLSQTLDVLNCCVTCYIFEFYYSVCVYEFDLISVMYVHKHTLICSWNKLNYIIK